MISSCSFVLASKKNAGGNLVYLKSDIVGITVARFGSQNGSYYLPDFVRFLRYHEKMRSFNHSIEKISRIFCSVLLLYEVLVVACCMCTKVRERERQLALGK